MNARRTWSPNADASRDARPDRHAKALGETGPADNADPARADPLDELMDARFDESGRLVHGRRPAPREPRHAHGEARAVDADDLHRAVEDLARRVELAQSRGAPRVHGRDVHDEYDDARDPYGESRRPYRGARRADDTMRLLDRLEDRLGVVGRRPVDRYGEPEAARGWGEDVRTRHNAPDFSRQITALESRVEQLADLAATPANEEIRADISAIGRQLDGMSRAERIVSGRMSAIQRQLAELREKLEEAHAPESDRFAALETRLDQIAGALASQPLSAESLSAVEHGYNHILERVAKIERLTETAVPPDEIWERIENLRDAFARLPTLDNLSALEGRIHGLYDRLDDLAAGHERSGETEGLEARLSELAGLIAEIRDRPSFDPADIHARLEALVERIEMLREQDRPPDLSGVEGRLDEIAGLVGRSAESGDGAALWKIGERLDGLAERIEALHGESPSIDVTGIEGRLDELAGLVGRAAEADKSEAFWKLDERLGDLAHAVAEQDNRLAGLDFSGLRDHLESLGTRVAELAETRNGGDRSAALSAKLEAIGNRLDSMGGLTRTDIAPIAARISMLETAIQAATADQRANLAPIQDRLDELSDELGRNRENQSVDARLADIQGRLASFPAGLALAGDLDEKLELLNAALRNAEELAALDDVSELRADIANLRRELRSLPAAAPGDGTEGAELIAILREITARLDRLPDEAPLTHRDLEGHLGPLLRRTAEDDGGTLLAIEGRLADLQDMLAGGSAIAMQAALPEDGRSRDHAAHIVSQVADALSTDLEILKDAAAATEHNTRRALEAVHETLEAVVKRMAFLERDAGRGGEPRPAAAAHVQQDPTDEFEEAQIVPPDPPPGTSAEGPDLLADFAAELDGDPAPEADSDAEPDLEERAQIDQSVMDAIAALAADEALPEEPERSVPVPEITLSDVDVGTDAADAEPVEAAEPTTFERLLDEHRPAPHEGGDDETTPQRGGHSLLGRLTPTQLLRRATGGKADSFSPDDDDRASDTLFEPGTDDPMSSSLDGAPSSDTDFMSGDRPERSSRASGPEPDPALVGAGQQAAAEAQRPSDEFLTAARRAAQAAAAEAMRAEYSAGLVDDGSAISRVVAGLNARRRLVLASAVAIAVAFAALQFVKLRILRPQNPSPAPIEMSANAPAATVLPSDTRAAAAIAEAPEHAAGAVEGPMDGGAAAFTGSSPAMHLGQPASPMMRPDESIAFSTPEAPARLTKQLVASGPAKRDVDQPTKEPGETAAGVAAIPAAAEVNDVLTVASTAPEPAVLDGSVFPALPPSIGPERLRQEAATADPVAMFEVAARFAEGRHVARDLSAAAVWYERAAEAGLAPAQYRLGSLYEKGQGVARNIRAAEAWYRRAAVAGNAKAMHNLAVLYAEGAGGNPDLKAAAGWFRRAAELGIRDSQFNIAILHARGLGVAEDLVEAYKWFGVAAASGDQQAAERRDTIAAALGRKDLARAKAAVEEFKPAAMETMANMVVRPEDNWGQTDPQKISQNMKDLILRTQQLLSASGYEVGKPDGVFGPRTRDAIEAFQNDIGMAVNGRVDTTLLAALEARAI